MAVTVAGPQGPWRHGLLTRRETFSVCWLVLPLKGSDAWSQGLLSADFSLSPFVGHMILCRFIPQQRKNKGRSFSGYPHPVGGASLAQGGWRG